MTKAVKAYNGSITATTTVYTVPASRVACVTLAGIDFLNGYAASAIFTALFGSFSRNITINAVTAGYGIATEGGGYSITSSMAGGTALMILPRTLYLVAGQSVVFSTDRTSTTINYSFSVVEEY